MTGVDNKKDTLDYSMDSNSTAVFENKNQLSMEDILTRDQRTTSHRVIGDRSSVNKSTPSSMGVRFESVDKSADDITGSSLGLLRQTINGSTTSHQNISSKVRHFSGKRIRGRSSYRRFTFTWLRLGSLLVTLLVASINGAPTMNSKHDSRFSGPPKWVNPCELQDTIELNDTYVVQLTDDQLLNQIVIQAKTAYEDAKIVKEKFITNVFQVKNFNDWNSQRYWWLPSREEIPKDLNEQLDKKFLEKLDLDTALLDAYGYMQKYAVALEQVVWDQVNQKRSMSREFESTEDKLRMVLCEIQVALVERQVEQRADVTRDIMKEEFRSMSKEHTQRDLRDWLIFRDYMNGLEYVAQVFEYFLQKTNNKS